MLNHNTALINIIGIKEENCVNCHICISACPVKFCNDGSGDHVKINSDLCIGCGNCLSACTHEARFYKDDFDKFLEDINQKKEKIIAVAAPSVAASFPDNFLRLNTWFKGLGVEAIFDVSFGAELTIISYLDQLKNKNKNLIIAQPCASIVTFIQIYVPELLPHLAQVDSPMLHTIKMIRHFYPQYADYKIAVISPCNAKKREFDATNLGDYNVGFKSIEKYLEKNFIDLSFLPESDYSNPPAERAVLFSTPGGLLQTAERWVPEIKNKTRKIEGTSVIYDYLEKLPNSIEKGVHPLLIDCLSCDLGCNGGPLTTAKGKPADEVEDLITKRAEKLKAFYKNNQDKEAPENYTDLEELIKQYWKQDLYNRSYKDLSNNNNIKAPNEAELKEIYLRMHKYSEKDVFNCAACGYGQCKKMATAIFNGLNRPENCHFYLLSETEISHKATFLSQKRLQTILDTTVDGFLQVDSQGKIIDANPSIKKMFKTDDIIGKTMFDFLDEENNRILLKQLELRAMNKSSTYELTFTASDGTKVDCLLSGTSLFDENNQRMGSFAMVSDITSLKSTEKMLAEKEIKFRTLFDTANSAIFLMQGNKFVECNKKTLEIFGCKSVDILKHTPSEFSPQFQPDGSLSEMKSAEKIIEALSGKPQIFEWLHCRLDKSVFDAEVSLNRMEFNGQVFIQAIVNDITQRKDAERELKKSHDELEVRVSERTLALSETIEELRVSQVVIEDYNTELQKLSLVASKTDNAIIILNQNGDLEWANDGFTRLFGFTSYEIINTYGSNILQISSNPNIKEIFKECEEQRKTVIYESLNKTKDDRTIWTQTTLTPIIDSDDVLQKYIAIDTDITNLKEAEFEIKQQQEEILSQRDALELKANELSEAYENLKKAQDKIVESEKLAALGQLIAGVAHEINTPLGAIRSAAGNITKTLEQVLNQLPGFFEKLDAPTQDKFFEIITKSITNGNPISAKEERKIRRLLSDQLEQLNIVDYGDFADTLVDMGILELSENSIELIKTKNSKSIIDMAYRLSGLLRSGNTINTATDRASKVVFALKNFAHFNQSGEQESFNVIDGIETVLTLYYNQMKHGIEVVRKYNEVPPIFCYPDELNQVWTNLLHNALQAMEHKGVLTVEVSQRDESVVVSFRDSGVGIPPEYLEKIFQPFFTTKPLGEGSGLGLDIVRKIVNKHNGKIEVESVPGNTLFSIILPISGVKSNDKN